MITVELSPYEARSLLRGSEFLREIYGDGIDREKFPLPAGHTVSPLYSAAMKLEMALTLAQEEIS